MLILPTALGFALDVGYLVMLRAGLPSNVRSRSKIAPVSCAKARLTRRALSSRRLPHIRQRAEFSLPCLGVYHWLRTQAPLTPARQDRSSYATFASAHLRHGALASLGNIDRSPVRCIHRPQRDTSSAGYRLLVSRASAGASRERGLLRPLRGSAFGLGQPDRFATGACRRAVPLRTPLATACAAHFVRGIPFLTHAPLARPSSMARFFS